MLREHEHEHDVFRMEVHASVSQIEALDERYRRRFNKLMQGECFDELSYAREIVCNERLLFVHRQKVNRTGGR